MAFWAEPPYVERAIIVSTPRPNTSGKGNENKKKLDITIKKRETLRNKNYSILFPGYSLGNGLSLNVWCLYGDASGQFVQLILIIFFYLESSLVLPPLFCLTPKFINNLFVNGAQPSEKLQVSVLTKRHSRRLLDP